jgi:hypothetical protein
MTIRKAKIVKQPPLNHFTLFTILLFLKLIYINNFYEDQKSQNSYTQSLSIEYRLD